MNRFGRLTSEFVWCIDICVYIYIFMFSFQILFGDFNIYIYI